MNGQVEVKWRTLITIEHSIMVLARVLDEFFPFFINIYDSSHIYDSTNKAFVKPGWWTHYVTQTHNLYKTFSIESTCSSFSMNCKESYCTHWWKGIKHASSIKKGFGLSSMELHNIKKSTSSTYIVNRK